MNIMMYKTDGMVTDYGDGYVTQNVMFTYSEEEQEENRIAKNNSKTALRPKFIPLYPALLWNGYSMMESLLFGFIDFFLSNNPGFYCTNEQLAELFNCSEPTISVAIKNLEKRGDIKIHKKMKAWWWTIRFITLESQKFWFSNIKKVDWIYNKIINNKIIDIKKEKIDKKEKKEYGEFKHIKLTDEEYEKVRRLVGWWISKLIEECDTWLELHPKKKYTNFYAFLKNRVQKNQKWKQNELEIKQQLYNSNKSKYKNTYNNKNVDIESVKQKNYEKIKQQVLSSNLNGDEGNEDTTFDRRAEIWG